MFTMTFVILTFQVLGSLILVNQVSAANYGALLSRLYNRAASSDRPLIVLIDSNILESNRPAYNRPYKILDAIGYNEIDYEPPSALVQKKKRLSNRDFYKPQKSYDIEKKLHYALLPKPKRIFSREKDTLRSPVIRNLLRISNNLKCQAKTECEDKCNNKFTGPKNDKCVNTCESKFDCEEEPAESGCDDCEANSCGDDDCTGSTKGYAVTDPPVGCPEC